MAMYLKHNFNSGGGGRGGEGGPLFDVRGVAEQIKRVEKALSDLSTHHSAHHSAVCHHKTLAHFFFSRGGWGVSCRTGGGLVR